MLEHMLTSNNVSGREVNFGVVRKHLRLRSNNCWNPPLDYSELRDIPIVPCTFKCFSGALTHYESTRQNT